MHPSAADFERPDSLLNTLAGRCAQADPICSRSEWQFAFHKIFAPKRALHLRQDSQNILALAEWDHPSVGPLLEPVEAHWFFSRSLMGPCPEILLEELLSDLEREDRRPSIALGGMDLEDPLIPRLIRLLGRHYSVGCLDPILFRTASLMSGSDGFLSRRSRKFRENIRRAMKKGNQAGITFERCIPTDEASAATAFARMTAVEQTSWKGIEQCGMTEEPYLAFYRDLFLRMSANGIARAIFARHEDTDIGFVMGGVAGQSYRGQQFSYAAEWAPFAIGNLLQWEMIQWLCECGVARYDMGSILEYKVHWTEVEFKSHLLVWRPKD